MFRGVPECSGVPGFSTCRAIGGQTCVRFRRVCGFRIFAMSNDIAKIRKPQTRLKRTHVCPPIAQRRRGQPYVEVSELYFYIYSLFQHL